MGFVVAAVVLLLLPHWSTKKNKTFSSFIDMPWNWSNKAMDSFSWAHPQNLALSCWFITVTIGSSEQPLERPSWKLSGYWGWSGLPLLGQSLMDWSPTLQDKCSSADRPWDPWKGLATPYFPWLELTEANWKEISHHCPWWFCSETFNPHGWRLSSAHTGPS